MSRSHVTHDSTAAGTGGGVPRWVKWTVPGLIAALALGFGAILLYAKVLNDSPDEFTAADIDEALSARADTVTDQVATPAPTPTARVATAEPPVAPVATEQPAATQPDPSEDAASSTSGLSGAWLVTDASQVGYRVEEVLFGVNATAVGRTNQVSGSLTIEGTAVTSTEFSVDVASITSDQTRRDAQFSGRIMSADEFPTATFTLTQPIELGTDPVDGATIAATATGELTLRGVTNPVTFEVTAKQESGLIGVQGSIPVVFADYSIANPSFGGIETEDHGLVEFVLVFEPA